MIQQERFLARSGTPEWFELRDSGISATAVAKASAGTGGYNEVIRSFVNPEPIPDNAYMAFGREQEQPIIEALPATLNLTHNDWLICADGPGNEWQLATPDGFDDSFDTVVEVKTTGKDWETLAKIPIQYRRQVQWQLHVTGAKRCIFAWMLRVESPSGDFVPGWIEPKWLIIERDEDEIAKLISVAQNLQMEKVNLTEWLTEQQEYQHG